MSNIVVVVEERRRNRKRKSRKGLQQAAKAAAGCLPFTKNKEATVEEVLSYHDELYAHNLSSLPV